MALLCVPSSPALEGEQFLLLKVVRWVSEKGKNPGAPGGLCRSPQIILLGPGGFQEPCGPCAAYGL